MNTYILLCLVALVAVIQTMPQIDDDDTINSNADDDQSESSSLDQTVAAHPRPGGKVLRHVHQPTEGKIYKIKAAGVTYRQRVRDNQCMVEYDGKYLTENSVIQLRKKLYRVEQCLLERVFHACGPNLLLMLNVVCRVVEQQPASTTTTTTPMPISHRENIPAGRAFIHRISPRASKTPRVITESCCENLCTISELTRYCHR